MTHLQLNGTRIKTSKVSEIEYLFSQRVANVPLAVLPNDVAAKRKAYTVLLGVNVPTAPIYIRLFNPNRLWCLDVCFDENNELSKEVDFIIGE